ncbi:MAG: (5-formylfuran-3-yl)methyl phosphate synthase [Methylomonas sp.]|nr:(5-formylfuran-3-yl)methyl phosphate synthase [Methylomonas sp.]PPD19538.1 MAG: hypothetical protein CTY23_11580 [Methylomonas sp.]PPD38554.1 MAG: hypothetical protein CTY17_09240 [Methylomonas sp.]PPD52697.1 MAG: hypothetical protein CTY11_08470 [Methylomonas sp.]
MTAMLASVNCIAEALAVETLGVDVIDLKQPAQGALGALDVGDVRNIVAALRPDTVVSATIGDMPMQPDIICDAVTRMAATGIAYVKIGVFPGGDWPATLSRLAAIAQTQALIAVLFADAEPDFAIIADLRKAGFRGVMLDTMNKVAGSLTQIAGLDWLTEFVGQAQTQGLLTGLAGSLRIDDIARLLPLKPDYLGFRGALCQHHERTATIDPDQVRRIKARISV